MAADSSLSKYEKIGFPDSYRAGLEPTIFRDICGKLSNLAEPGRCVVDIGPGCSDLPALLIDLCRKSDHQLTLIDSAEMLRNLPDTGFLTKIAAHFPDCSEALEPLHGRVDALLCYSVLHYVVGSVDPSEFLDAALELLAPGGQFLIGDIPNVSKRKRFFASEAGVRFHKQFMNTTQPPQVQFNRVERGRIDDSVVFALLQRARLAGFDAYVLPQGGDLPMANRREDILIVRP